jgi:thiamine-monophosphate kinase
VLASPETLLIGALRSSIEPCPFQKNAAFEADAELLDTGGDELHAVTIDTLHAGEELDSAASPYAKGWLAATASLSDLAAVGARPLATLVSCSFPRDEMSEEEARAVGRGAAEATRAQGAYLVGGDTNWAAEESLTGCAIGVVARDRALTRMGARAGDVLYVSGPVGGGNAAGARTLLGEDAGASAWLPSARCDAGAALGGLARACIDTSDGLVAAALMLADLNGLGVEIEDSPDLYDPLALELAARLGLPRWLLAAGEWGEFELAFAVGPSEEDACLDALAGTTASPRRVGTLTRDRRCSIVAGDTRIDALETAAALRRLERDGGLVDALSDLVGSTA